MCRHTLMSVSKSRSVYHERRDSTTEALCTCSLCSALGESISRKIGRLHIQQTGSNVGFASGSFFLFPPVKSKARVGPWTSSGFLTLEWKSTGRDGKTLLSWERAFKLLILQNFSQVELDIVMSSRAVKGSSHRLCLIWTSWHFSLILSKTTGVMAWLQWCIKQTNLGLRTGGGLGGGSRGGLLAGSFGLLNQMQKA